MEKIMKKFSGLLSARNPYGWALVFSLIIIILVAAFTTLPADGVKPVQASQANLAAAELPAYCTVPGSLNVLNKYGRGTPIVSKTMLYRVAGDWMYLSLGDLPADSDVNYSLYLLTSNKKQVLYDFGDFDAKGKLSFLAVGGAYAVGMTLTSDQFDACGGSTTFANTIPYQDNIFVIAYYLTIDVLQPTAQPRVSEYHPVFD
jgi:hypothetical protein